MYACINLKNQRGKKISRQKVLSSKLWSQLSVIEAKPKSSNWPITKDMDNPVNQSVARSPGKRVRACHDWFGFNFLLVEKVARVFFNQSLSVEKNQRKREFFPHSGVDCSNGRTKHIN